MVTRRTFLSALGAGAVAISFAPLVACSKKSTSATTASASGSLEDGPLVVYNWGEYGPVTQNIAGFLRATGANIDVENFSNNEEMLTQVRAGSGGWDIIVPQDYQVTTMTQENLLLALNKELIPNMSNVDPLFLNPSFDPGNKYTVPKTWGGTGFLWRSDLLGEHYDSWSDFVRLAEQNSGKAIVMDSPVDVIGSALRATGNSLNATDDAALQAALDWLLALKPHLLSIVPPGEITPLLVSEDGLLALSPANDAFQARVKHGLAVGWTYPVEGALEFLDNWAIPATSSRPNLAHAFMNYMLTPKAAAAEMNNLAYNTVNKSALESGLVDQDMAAFLQPSPEAEKNYEFQQSLDAQARRKRDELWTKFISA